MTTLGVFIGGWSVAKLGLIRTMVIGAFMSPVSNLVFAWLATQGPERAGPDHRDRRRQHRHGLRRHGPDRLYVQPDLDRLHRHPVRAVQLALRPARQADRLAVAAASSRGRPGRPRRAGSSAAEGSLHPPARRLARGRRGDQRRQPGRAGRGLRRLLPLFDRDRRLRHRPGLRRRRKADRSAGQAQVRG